MEENVLLGRERYIVDIPQATWRQRLAQVPEHSQTRLRFMTDAHHQVRYFVVKELVRGQKPIAPEFIAEMLALPLEQVKIILDELESKLFFLVRNAQGAVAWAYPMTVEKTPHRLKFDTGEQLYAA